MLDYFQLFTVLINKSKIIGNIFVSPLYFHIKVLHLHITNKNLYVMKELTRESVRDISSRINEVLKSLEKEFGVTIDMDNDAVKNSDVNTFDQVDAFFDGKFGNSEQARKFYDVIDIFSKKGLGMTHSDDDVYNILFGNSSTALKDAILYINSLIKKSKK